MKKKKVLVLGYFGYQSNQLDGQTVKTRNVYSLLKSREAEANLQLEYFDTQSFKVAKINFLKMVLLVSKANVLFYLGAYSNLNYIFPILYWICKLKKIELHYVVVGGWLADFISDKSIHIRMLSKIKAIYPETASLVKQLETRYGYTNVFQLNNFRISEKSISLASVNKENGIIRLVFMARVNPKKGVEAILNLSRELKSKELNHVRIDFFGPILQTYSEEFFKKIGCVDENTAYRGEIDPRDINGILINYDLMLFPTKYYTEGLPGSILDAYIAGIPVIASRWKYADEFVLNGISGIITEFDNDEDFVQKTMELLSSPELLERLKLGAKGQAKKYSPEVAWRIVKEHLF